jgi:hypothetical protein
MYQHFRVENGITFRKTFLIWPCIHVVLWKSTYYLVTLDARQGQIFLHSNHEYRQHKERASPADHVLYTQQGAFDNMPY